MMSQAVTGVNFLIFHVIIVDNCTAYVTTLDYSTGTVPTQKK